MVLDTCIKGNKKQFCMSGDTNFKQPQKYYHSKLILFYPWKNEDDLITGFNSYMESYIDKQDVIHKNAKSFNEDCETFHSALEAFENDVIPQSAWDSIVPSIAEENAVTNTRRISDYPDDNWRGRTWWYYCNKTCYKCTTRNRSTIKIIC